MPRSTAEPGSSAKPAATAEPATTARGALGRYGEDVAAQHLVGAGLTVLARNWRCREGELDIVACEGDALVICEVKTRRGVGFGTPLDAVTPAKAARIRRLAAHWLAVQRADGERASGVGYSQVRFDVVSVLRPATGPAIVEHLRGAF